MDSRRGSSLKGLWIFRTWLILLVGVLGIAAGTMIWATAARGNDQDRDDKKGFEGRGSRNDDDWDDHDNWHRREKYTIGLWGDMPYSDLQANPGVDPNLIEDMNSQDLAFTVHDGDLKAGSVLPGSTTPVKCDEAKYTQALGFFAKLRAPAAFTPGDNDWTDCDNGFAANSNGPYNSLERLDRERVLFFSTPFTLGQHKLHQAEQTTVTDGISLPCKGFKHGAGLLDVNGNGLDTDQWTDVACVENRRWTYRGVTYATLNIQGSCNNLCKDHPDPVEWDARNKADIDWMQETFEVAKERDSAAIMFISQADPGFDRTDPTRSPLRDPKTLTEMDVVPAQDGFKTFLAALRTEAEAFRKPVAYVHGDSHYFRIDKPFYDSLPVDSPALAFPPPVNTSAVAVLARHLENFTRVETFGDNVITTDATHPNPADLNNIHWVKVFVDPDSREVFSYQPQSVPGNRVVVPAP